jgi:hypothetical protein
MVVKKIHLDFLTDLHVLSAVNTKKMLLESRLSVYVYRLCMYTYAYALRQRHWSLVRHWPMAGEYGQYRFRNRDS